MTLSSKRNPVLFAAMILERNGTIFLVKRRSDALIEPGYYQLVGGKPDVHESLIACAVRETYEEVGVVVDPDQLTFLGISDIFTDTRHLIGFNFLACDWQGTPHRKSPREHEGADWFALDSIPDLMTVGTRLAVHLLRDRTITYVTSHG